MSALARRGVLLGAVASSMVGLVPLRASNPLALPHGSLQLTRRIERRLSGGAMIMVERQWTVRFSRQGSGAAIMGSQTSVDVDAPDALAAIAQIEQSRSTEAMFPILLSDSGAIVAAGASVREQDLAEAIREAREVIGLRDIAPDARAEQLRYLALLQNSAGKMLDRLPPDLFFPASPPMHNVQTVVLADGLQGEFEVSYHASPAPGQSWLERAERVVRTRIGETEQRSREVWTMLTT